MRNLIRAVPFVLVSLVIGCGNGLAELGADGGSPDAGNGMRHDSPGRDSGDHQKPDGAAVDSRGVDSGDRDSANVDAFLQDSGALDSAQQDSGHLDATGHDANTVDATGQGPDNADATSGDSGGTDSSTSDSTVVDAGYDATDAAEAVAPTVLSTVPSSGRTSVSIAQILTATFSEAMKPTTISALSFALRDGRAPVLGSVSYAAAGRTATFVPTVPLAVGVVYTATITTGATSAAGVPLASNYMWSFTTAACGQAPVALNSAATFVVLAGSTVTSSGPTSLTGNVGVSPGTAVTGFPPGTVTGGAIQAGNPAAAQAKVDLTKAYNDAAGRTLCPVTVAGNLGGQTLTPGLYKSTSSLAISSGNLTLDAEGNPDAVFIFQMASTLTVTSGLKVVLSGGAKSTNVFWQVGTSATLGTTTSFQGTILAHQAISMDTGATLNGRALTSVAAVTLLSNVAVEPAP